MTPITRRRAAGQWLVFAAVMALVIGGMLFLAGQVLVQSCACATPPDQPGIPAAQAGVRV